MRYSCGERMSSYTEKILLEVDKARDEIVDFAADLIRIPTSTHPERRTKTRRVLSGLVSPISILTSTTSPLPTIRTTRTTTLG